MRRSTVTLGIALAATGALALGALPAAAAPPGGYPPPAVPSLAAEHLAGPLTFDVGVAGTLYVGQAFAGALTEIRRHGGSQDLVGPTGNDLAAVSTAHGTVTWAETVFGPVHTAVLMRRATDGTVSTLADLYGYESAVNPDAAVSYGFQGLDAECIALLPPDFQPYTGIVDSHPYGSVSHGAMTYVADAGANAILSVADDGTTSTVAVLPGVAVPVTQELADAFGMPSCVAGHDFLLEPVPTDVELGTDGQLYVSSLPGGPEDGSLGANGAVYRVDPSTGGVTLLAGGFAGATNVAVAPNGTVYVAELFGGKVSAISPSGEVRTVVTLDQPAGIEWSSGRLYVSTNVFGDGSIVSFTDL